MDSHQHHNRIRRVRTQGLFHCQAAEPHRLFLTTFVLILSDYTQNVYEPYVTSEFRQHSAISAARVVNSIARICSFPLVAKLSDVLLSMLSRKLSNLTGIRKGRDVHRGIRYINPLLCSLRDKP